MHSMSINLWKPNDRMADARPEHVGTMLGERRITDRDKDHHTVDNPRRAS
jgi:hypothetical protein